MEIMEKANKLANINPNDPKALEAIGSKVQCRVQFRIGYQTQVGEDLFIVGSHKKMGEWNQHHALPCSGRTGVTGSRIWSFPPEAWCFTSTW